MKLSTKQIHKTTSLKSTKEEVFHKWTTNEGIRTFMAKDSKVELRIGGPFEIYFMPDAPEGSKGSEGCTFISYLPNQMLSFTWNAPPQFKAIREGDHHTWVVILLEDNVDGTQLNLYHLGWPEGEEWDKVYAYFDKAWEMVLQWLKKSLQT